MIKITNIIKNFGDVTALNELSCEIPEGCMFGLVGSNGAGKSTLLRLIMGIYKADGGLVEVDGENVYENEKAKGKMVFVPDELYFVNNADMKRMALMYKTIYKNFDEIKYVRLAQLFNLPLDRPISSFSKGMKRLVATALALSCNAKYIFFDETFDGLDPVMRALVKQVIYDDICERNATAVITSHSLRELEDTCDQLALLHQGGIVFQSEINDLDTKLSKIQVAFADEFEKGIFEGIEIIKYTQNQRVANLIVKGDKTEIKNVIKAKNPLLIDVLPLSLEEVFVYELKQKGYDFDNQ